MMKRLLVSVLLVASSHIAYANLLPPNPFIDKANFWIEINSIFENASLPERNNIFPIPTLMADSIYELNYGKFKLWVDCSTRRTTRFEYTLPMLYRMNPQTKHSSSYFRESKLPQRCQQTSTLPYGQRLLRSYIVDPALLANSKSDFELANTMTNVIPIPITPPSDGNTGETYIASQLTFVNEKIVSMAQRYGVSVKGELTWSATSKPIITHGIAPPAFIKYSLSYVDGLDARTDTYLVLIQPSKI